MRRALSVSVQLALLVGACRGPLGVAREAVVYGEDGRTEIYAHPNAALRAVAESAVAMKISARLIDDAVPTDLRLDYTRTLGEAKNLCAGERFADQIEPGTCSGTLIDSQHLLTAGHCMDAVEDCTNSAWLFGFRYVAAGELAPPTRDDVYRCARTLAYFDDGFVDHAIVELDRPVVGHTPAPVRIEAAGLATATPLALIGHPNGIPMKIDDGGVVTTSSGDATSLEATLDAFNGNSGSGVFDHAGQLVALLRGGEDDYVDAGGCNVVNVIDPAPTDDGEGLTYVRPALEAFCRVPGVVSPLCDCDGPCVPALEGDRCEDAVPIEPVTQTITASLAGYAPDHEGRCGGGGPDRVYVVEIAERTRLTARVSGYDSVLYLRSACAGADVACHDDVDPETDRGSRIEAVIDPGTYRIFVDAYDADVGAFSLALTFAPEALAPDAGPPPAPDAGTPPGEVDAGITPPPGGGDGCACRAAPRGAPDPRAFPLLFVVALLSLARATRRR